MKKVSKDSISCYGAMVDVVTTNTTKSISDVIKKYEYEILDESALMSIRLTLDSYFNQLNVSINYNLQYNDSKKALEIIPVTKFDALKLKKVMESVEENS